MNLMFCLLTLSSPLEIGPVVTIELWYAQVESLAYDMTLTIDEEGKPGNTVIRGIFCYDRKRGLAIVNRYPNGQIYSTVSRDDEFFFRGPEKLTMDIGSMSLGLAVQTGITRGMILVLPAFLGLPEAVKNRVIENPEWVGSEDQGLLRFSQGEDEIELKFIPGSREIQQVRLSKNGVRCALMVLQKRAPIAPDSWTELHKQL